MTNFLEGSKIKLFLISLIIPLIFLFISLLTINDYGETTDEKFDQHIGEFYYYQWKEKGLDGLNKRFIELQRNYGPLFDVIAVASNDVFYKRTGIIKNPVASYHLPVIIISVITIFFTFWYAYLNWGIIPAFLSSLTLTLMPRFIGDSQNNLKDTPTMTFFLISLFFFFLALKKSRLLYYLIAGFFLGLTYTIKINAIAVLPIVGLWTLLTNKLNLQKLTKFAFSSSLSLVMALITILIFWPYYRYDTLIRFIETYKTFKYHVWNEYILYLGNHYRGHEVPWHYPFVIFGVTLPTFYLVLFLISLFIAIYYIYRRNPQAIRLIFLFSWIVIPTLSQVISGAPMYDGIRHFLVILPPIAILIGFTVWKIGKFLQESMSKNSKFIYVLYIVIISFSYTSLLLTNIRIHPYQIVYFNGLVGGIKGAYGKFDLDYWGQSLKQAAQWINNSLPNNSRIWLTIPMAHHFPIDRDRFFLVSQFPDYKVSLIRGMLKTWDTEEDYLNPKTQPIYTVNVDGADILQIFEYPENHEAISSISLDSLSQNVSSKNKGLKTTVFSSNHLNDPPNQTISFSVGFSYSDNNYNDKLISLRYEGYLYIPKTKDYCFQIKSDDDALFKLNNTNIIANPSMKTSVKKIQLNFGYYKFQLDYVNNTGAAQLEFYWSTNDCQDFTNIPSNLFSN